MAFYYSPTQRGFYHDQVHETLPDDAVEITDAEWQRLLDRQTAGDLIVPGDGGKPIAVSAPVVDRAIGLRAARNRLLAQTDGLVNRHRDEVYLSLGTTAVTTVSDEQYTQLQTWRQALRALPAAAGFPDIALPSKPEWLELK